MLNRFNPAATHNFEARRTITAELRERLRDIPASPLDWNAFDLTVPQLADLQGLLCSAPARTEELRALWRESVATAEYARRLAPHVGSDAVTSAIAGLLHRLGDMLTLRAIGEIEHAGNLRLDAASKADLCAAVHGPGQLESVVRAWGVPPRAAATAAEWRRLCEFPGAAADATAVCLARLLAVELLSPQFCVPGMVDSAISEAGLEPRDLDALRRADGALTSITALPS